MPTDSPKDQSASFRTTHWSLVVEAGRPSSIESKKALEELCEQYWYPIYAFIRRRGHDSHEAQDLTQEFLMSLLESDVIEKADAEKGRFRTFLLTVLKRFLSHQRDKDNAIMRGGHMAKLSLDFEQGESRYQLEPTDEWTPEMIYQRRWALTLLEKVLGELNKEYQEHGKTDLFRHFRAHLVGDADRFHHSQLAAELGMSEGAVKASVHRLRSRYRELLKAEVRKSVDNDDQVSSELDLLLNAVQGIR